MPLKRLLGPLTCLTLAATSVPLLGTAPAQAEEWKDSECEYDKDGGGNDVKICRDGEALGVFWDDGSYVNGACGDQFEYDGLREADAQTWIDDYCQ